jgi:ATP-dependent exoDNAse (exonuclease V) beta subunit
MRQKMEQITASAGSGKTYTLTRRFLAHLANALPEGGPSMCLLEDAKNRREGSAEYSLAGILAATFTNKAATEMQARVIRELKQQALAKDGGDPDFPLKPEAARRWLEVILRRFDAVNIRTIDSLLTLLVRLNALSLSLPPDFAPLFSLEETLLPLYDALLDSAAREPDGELEDRFRKACRSLILHQRSTGLAAGKALYKRLQDIIEMALQGAELPSENDGGKAAAMFMELHKAVTESADALLSLCDAENLSLIATGQNYLMKCRDTRPMKLPDFKSVYAGKESFDDLLKKDSQGKASADAERMFRDFQTACAKMTEDGPALLTTIEYTPFVYLAKILLYQLDKVQKEEGFVPASRLSALALESLEDGGVSDAFCRLGDTLAHLLFDEFQDTSTDQWQAIIPLVRECLSQGGSLTYVGDVKQAIYGWRGGNAELFDAVAEDKSLTNMLETGAAHTTLSHNWRSFPAIVETNNRVFGRLAEPEFARRVLESMLPATTDEMLFADAVMHVSSAFALCEQAVPEKNASKGGYVRLTRIEERATQDLYAKVKEELDALLRDELLPARTPGEIAVLVRKNSEAAMVAEWLAEWEIPVVTESSFRLGSHPLITRIVDTLSFLEYPLDDAAFWSAVSGPEIFGGAVPNAMRHALPDAARLSSWLAKTQEFPSGALFLAFRRDFPEAWRQTLAPFYDQAGLLSAYDMVCEIIRHCKLRERFPEHEPFLERLAEVAHAAEDKGFSSLSAFLDFWAEAGGEERVPMPENMDAVRILTMHKSKGLEFPVVIVPFHHQGDLAAKPLTVVERNGMHLLTLRENDTKDAIRGIMEQINLLYVTWTRPSEELYAFITRTGFSASRSSMGKALEALLEAIPFKDGVYAYGKQAEAARKQTEEPTRKKSAGEDAAPTAVPEPLITPGPLMAWLPRLKIFRNPIDGKGFTERQRGLLAHACLEALRFPPNIPRAVEQGMRAFPISLPDPDAVKNDMAEILTWYASLPEAPVWLRYGNQELPLMDTDGSIRRVDLLVDEPGKDVLAVEYKTGQPSPDHIVQVQRYLSLLGPAVRRRHERRGVSGAIVYLDREEIIPMMPGDSHV